MANEPSASPITPGASPAAILQAATASNNADCQCATHECHVQGVDELIIN